MSHNLGIRKTFFRALISLLATSSMFLYFSWICACISISFSWNSRRAYLSFMRLSIFSVASFFIFSISVLNFSYSASCCYSSSFILSAYYASSRSCYRAYVASLLHARYIPSSSSSFNFICSLRNSISSFKSSSAVFFFSLTTVDLYKVKMANGSCSSFFGSISPTSAMYYWLRPSCSLSTRNSISWR